MKRSLNNIVVFIVLLLLIIAPIGCQDGDEDNEPTYQEILSDVKFEKGIAISKLQSRDTVTTWWKYSGDADSSVQPDWFLGQYCDLSTTRYRMDGETVVWRYDSSRNDLSLGTLFEEGKGIESKEGNFYKLTNASGSKILLVNPTTGEIHLNVDTSKEYIGEDGNVLKRSPNEDWVHMILQQPAGGVNISRSKTIKVTIEFEITQAEILDASIGASQFQWIFAIKDYDSPTNNYFWFNITLFDDRYQDEMFEGMQHFDSGKQDATGKFIYSPKGNLYLDEPVVPNKKYLVEKDFKPLMIEAFEAAKGKGALQNSRLESMALTSLNIGWEVSNLAKVGLKITRLSLQVS